MSVILMPDDSVFCQTLGGAFIDSPQAGSFVRSNDDGVRCIQPNRRIKALFRPRDNLLLHYISLGRAA